MKILVLSWYFPPGNDIGAIRVARTAEFLQRAGHDVWVLTGDRAHTDKSLATSLPTDRIVQTPWFDVDRLSPTRLWRRGAKPGQARASQPTKTGTSRVWRSKLAIHYRNLFRIPDHQVGWLPSVLRAGRKLLGLRAFDLIYASGPPFTAFFAARSLSRQFGVPWIAEYRDAWSDDVYTPRPHWRRALDTVLENSVTRTATAIVAVSQPRADYLQLRFGKPTAAIYNGFDANEFITLFEANRAANAPLSIVYLGGMYNGMRDPSVLYEAFKLSQLSPQDVRLSYYGPSADEIWPLASAFGVKDFISVESPVPHARSLEIQRSSDILLLLQSPLDSTNVPAKVFEYFGARRPILGLGLDQGVPAKLIRERGAGFYATNAVALAEQLRRWVAVKREQGMIPDLPKSVRAGLSRNEQLKVLEGFLRSVI